MYDRASDSHWPQILGAAVEGTHKGEGLRQERVFWTTWERWQERHPDTAVLSRETGHARNYRRDPYGGYNPKRRYYVENSARIFPVFHESDRYPPKREVFGFRTANEAVAVDRGTLAERGILRRQGGRGDFLVLHDPGRETA
jgi:peptidoglycan/xylan/chitin deacetylase (PgdA/CDA1 family)